MSADFVVVIPARYGSTRLQGKAIVDVGGRPMVQRTFDQARLSGAAEVIVATDDARVRDGLLGYPETRVMMTSREHPNGTARVAEVADRLGLDDESVVVNVQGDEPLIPPAVIAQVADNLVASGADMATLCESIESSADLFDPAVVKVVFDTNGFALYFSRAPIPWHRDAFAAAPRAQPDGARHWRHIGLYAYRSGFLRRYVRMASTDLERAEALEQLRALYHGARIHVAEAAERPGPGIDTAADLERVRRLVE